MAVVMFCTVVMPVTAPASWETALLLCWFHKYPVEMTESKKKHGGWNRLHLPHKFRLCIVVESVTECVQTLQGRLEEICSNDKQPES